LTFYDTITKLACLLSTNHDADIMFGSFGLCSMELMVELNWLGICRTSIAILLL